MIEKSQYIRDLKDKETVSSSFLIKESQPGTDKNGKPFLTMVLMDRSGELEARLWSDFHQYVGQAVSGAIVQVEGRCQTHQGRKQIVANRLQILREDQVKIDEYLSPSHVNVDELYAKLKSYVSSMSDPFYKALAEAVLIEDSDIVSRMKRAPAAKSVHHAYKGGLLEHMVSIMGILDHLAGHYKPYVDRDLLFLGGFFHDIAKIWELSYDTVTDYTTEGRLVGHLVMGVELIERKIQELETQSGRLPAAFPQEKRLLVKHMILAHHGKLEYGSPKRPKCLEALIVHYVDDLDSKVNAIRCFIEQDASPGEWTGLNRMYERFFFKPEWAQNQES